MEEDLKILKDIIEQDFSNPMGWSYYYDSELRKLQQAIEHLIKAYKELKEKLDETLNANLALVQGNANSIPVSLVEEKIEELDEELEIMKVDAMYGKYKKYGSKLSFEKQ